MGIIYNIRLYNDTILSSTSSFAKKNELCVLYIGQWYIRWPDDVPKIIFLCICQCIISTCYGYINFDL